MRISILSNAIAVLDLRQSQLRLLQLEAAAGLLRLCARTGKLPREKEEVKSEEPPVAAMEAVAPSVVQMVELLLPLPQPTRSRRQRRHAPRPAITAALRRPTRSWKSALTRSRPNWTRSWHISASTSRQLLMHSRRAFILLPLENAHLCNVSFVFRCIFLSSFPSIHALFR